MDVRKLCFCFVLVLSLLLRPVLGTEEEEVFDPDPWEAEEAFGSLEDVAGRVGAAVLMEREQAPVSLSTTPTPACPPPALPKS